MCDHIYLWLSTYILREEVEGQVPDPKVISISWATHHLNFEPIRKMTYYAQTTM